jgi:hypothetical protein
VKVTWFVRVRVGAGTAASAALPSEPVRLADAHMQRRYVLGGLAGGRGALDGAGRRQGMNQFGAGWSVLTPAGSPIDSD